MFIKWFPEYWISNVVIEYISHNAFVGPESKSEYLSFCCSHNLSASTERNTRTHTHTIWIELKTAGFFFCDFKWFGMRKAKKFIWMKQESPGMMSKSLSTEKRLKLKLRQSSFYFAGIMAHKTIIFDYNWVWVAVNFFSGKEH